MKQAFGFVSRRLASHFSARASHAQRSSREPHARRRARPSLKVSQSTLAEMVGTTRARVSKFMTGFKEKGFVNYNGGLQINDALIATFLQRSMSVKKQA
jgi:CRP-like cAMP-binding protein